MQEMSRTLTIVLFVISTLSVQSSNLRHSHSHGFQRLGRGAHPLPDPISADEKLALAHSERVFEAGACNKPKMQVVHVSDHFPGRYFLPHCTLLHRCGKHAGCCGTDRLRCVASEKEKVTLHFYSVRVLGDGVPAERKIEKLVFANHTKCACVPNEAHNKNDL